MPSSRFSYLDILAFFSSREGIFTICLCILAKRHIVCAHLLNDILSHFHTYQSMLYNHVTHLYCDNCFLCNQTAFLGRKTMISSFFVTVRVGRKNPKKLTQLSSRSHPRHLVGKKGQHKKTSP